MEQTDDGRKSLLIVDDFSINRMLLANIFESDFKIVMAENGQEALDIIRRDCDDIAAVLLDLNMPVMNGFDVLRIVRDDPELSKIPIIVISSAEQQDEVEALKLGADDFIQKPFEPVITEQRVRNITGRRELEQMRYRYLLLKEQTEAQIQLSAILSNLPGAVAVLAYDDHEYSLRYCNETLHRLAGYETPDDFLDIARGDFIATAYAEDAPLLDEELSRAFHDIDYQAVVPFRLVNRQADLHWVRLVATAFTSQEGELLLYCVLVDISQEKAQEEINRKVMQDLRFRAEYDTLTSIYNAQTFYQKAKKLLAEHEGEDYLIFCWNIEQFKLINDFFDRDLADEVLKVIADVFTRNVTPFGVCARMGGDHFAGCLPAKELDLEKMYAETESRLSQIGLVNMVNIGTGIYDHADTTLPVERMYDFATIACNSVKGSYLTRVVHYDEALRERIIFENEIRNDMQDALERGDFILHYQPVFDTLSNAPVSAEVLVRWMHPTKGLISPGDFIPLFERNGFIAKLDAYVCKQACEYLRTRLDAGKPVLPLSVNLSRADLFDPTLSKRIVDLVDSYRLDHSMLRFEITESAYADKPERLLQTVGELRERGFAILIDDFGSGYSSLNALKDIPVDILKIDMLFLKDFTSTGKAGNILTSVIRMASRLNLRTIAEGVETDGQLEFLESAGCRLIQGYYFSRPLPEDAFDAYLAEHGVEKSVIAESPSDGLDQETLNYLLGSPELFSAAFDRMPCSFGIYDLVDENRLELIRGNSGYRALTGCTRRNCASGMNAFDLIAKDDLERLRAAFPQARKTRLPIRLSDVGRLLEDGGIVRLDIVICYLGNRDSSPLYFVFLTPAE